MCSKDLEDMIHSAAVVIVEKLRSVGYLHPELRKNTASVEKIVRNSLLGTKLVRMLKYEQQEKERT